MSSIQSLKTEYSGKIDHFDLDLLISDVLKKPREFVLAHPEYELSAIKIKRLKLKIARRIEHKPLAYILGHKEFYGLDFKVNKHTLIPRPETELLVDLVLRDLKAESCKLQTNFIDVGTGSGNIIISLACNMQPETHSNINFYGVDISQKALAIAKYNAKKNKVAEQINPAPSQKMATFQEKICRHHQSLRNAPKLSGRCGINFIESDMLEYFIKNHSLLIGNLIILANLPYLSQEIYNSAPTTVKKYEPKSALYSGNNGLAHYEKLLKHIKQLQKLSCFMLCVSCFMEISPEQKIPLLKIIEQHFPQAKTGFFKDLAGKWRVVKIEI